MRTQPPDPHLFTSRSAEVHVPPATQRDIIRAARIPAAADTLLRISYTTADRSRLSMRPDEDHSFVVVVVERSSLSRFERSTARFRLSGPVGARRPCRGVAGTVP